MTRPSAAEEAVKVLEALPPGKELAWAYGSLAGSMWGSGEAVMRLLGKVADIGEQFHYPDVVCWVLNATGLTLVEAGQDAIGQIEESLRIALHAGLPEPAGRAYSSLIEACAKRHWFAGSERYYAEGLAYCEGRELGVFSMCINGWRARALLLLGRWDEAVRICARSLGSPGISPLNQVNPLCVLGTIRGRRGEDGAWELLDRALGSAEATGEPAWIAPVRAVRAELSWLEGRPDLAVAEAQAGYDVAPGRADPWTFGSLAIWLPRLGAPPDPLPGLPEPYALEIAGDHRGAVAAWEQIGRPYDAALLLWLGCTMRRDYQAEGGAGHAGEPRRDGGRHGGPAADAGAGHAGDPAWATPRHPGRSRRADRPRAAGPGPGRGRLGRPGDLAAAVHLRADRAPSRLRGAVQDRCLVPDRCGPRGRPAGHRTLTPPRRRAAVRRRTAWGAGPQTRQSPA